LPAQAIEDRSLTHVVVGDKPEGMAAFKPPRQAIVVQSQWLEDCLSKQQRLRENAYRVDPHTRLQDMGLEGV
jgi:hypothetical protein